MAYKCRICGSNEVEHPDDICELCAIGPDPYAIGNAGKKEQDFFGQKDVFISEKEKTVLIGRKGGDDLTETAITAGERSEPPAQVHASGQAIGNIAKDLPPATRTPNGAANLPITAGIVKNIVVDTQRRSSWEKVFRALFQGIPYAMDDTATMFQVFPGFTGTALNAQGNACDQVIVYGRLAAGTICENNNVEVYGKRDKNNIVIAKRVRNVASGTTITPQRVIDAGFFWILAAVILAMIAGIVLSYGTVGLVWAIVLVLCFTNMPLVFRILGVIFAIFFTGFRRRR